MAGEESKSLERVMSGKSWEEFCDTLKAAGQVILAEGSPANALDRAEGFQLLVRRCIHFSVLLLSGTGARVPR